MAERIRDRGPDGAGGWLESACKLIISVRAGILLVTLLSLPDQDERTAAIVAIVVAGAASFVPLRFWARVGPGLVRHPAYFAGELVLTTVILLLTGIDSPFVYYAQATALLGGLLYGRPGAALSGLLLVGVYFWVLDRETGPLPDAFQDLVAQPALYLVAAAAGASARRLLDRQAEAEASCPRRSAGSPPRRSGRGSRATCTTRSPRPCRGSASRRSRSRAGSSATRRARWWRRAGSPRTPARRRARRARSSSGCAPTPASRCPCRSPSPRWRGSWAEDKGVALDLAVEDVGELHPATGRELEWIVQEALANVSRHARATRVAVRMRRLGGRAVLTVTDDGAGFEVPDELDELGAGRHFGVGGMRERALLAGGDLSVESAPGEGCVMSVWVPTEIVPREMGPPEGAARAPGARRRGR